MNCVNCGTRLTFFNETDELWSGTEHVFCVSCRRKIRPFLEEPATAGNNLDHLRERKSALIARGLTAEGFAHLSDYCRYLDSLIPGPKAEIPDEIPAEPIPEGEVKPTQTGKAPTTAVKAGNADTRALLEAQKRANGELQSGIDSLSAELADSNRILSDRLQKLQDRIRLLSYLAAGGALGGLLAALAALIVLLR